MEDLRLSVSKTKCFAQCKKQFEFNYILKFPKKERDYHIFGKFCHKVLEDFHLAYINGSTLPFNKEMSIAFKAAKEEFKANMTPEMTKECFELINRYLQLHSADKSGNVVTACEKNFSFNISKNVILNGMIDRVQLDADGIWHVADYKTTKNKKYLKNDWFQLMTYGFVMITEDPSIEKIRGSYILLRHDFEYITTEFTVPQLLEMKDKYLKYANDILNEKEYKASPSVLCDWCDFKDDCDSALNKKINTVHGPVSW